MTIREFFAAIGIGNLDKDVELPAPDQQSSIIEQQQPDQKPEQQQTPETSPTVDPQIAALQKELADLKATNARLLSQTPVEHEQTADEALLELLGIGVENNGTD